MLTESHHSLIYALYFAPRGKQRLLTLGMELAQRYLSPMDRLVGFIGDAGAGKSLLIKGMFPGLELTNDDDGVNVRPLPLLSVTDDSFFSAHTFHVDIRFEQAFTQPHVLATAIRAAVDKGKRVVVEHFDLIYPFLGLNAEILIGIGEEVVVTRPNVFGPRPRDIAEVVFSSIRFRKMVHTAEDLTALVIEREYGHRHPIAHGDVRRGFVLLFTDPPEIDIAKIETLVQRYIADGTEISFADDNHIRIGGEERFHCTGPRIHVHNAAEIENFRLLPELLYDPIARTWSLVGKVGDENPDGYEEAIRL